MDCPAIIIISEQKLDFNVHDTVWIPCSSKFFSLGDDSTAFTGTIQLHGIENGRISTISKIVTEKPVKCGTLGASSLKNRHLAVGDFAGNLHIWDIEKSSQIYSVQAHKEIIHTIDGFGGLLSGYGAPEIVTGGSDGRIKVWDPRLSGRPVVVIETCGNTHYECWASAFGNSYNSQERSVCGGFENGDVKIFDLRKMQVMWETSLPNGVCSVEFDSQNTQVNRLLVTGLEGMVQVFDNFNTQIPVQSKQIECKKSTVWKGKHLPQSKDIFATCNGSGSINIMRYDTSGHTSTISDLQNSKVSTQSITSFDWSPDKTDLAVCASMDQTARLLYFSRMSQYH